MRMFVVVLLVCLLPGVAMAGDSDGSMLYFLERSDVVVLGQFTSKPIGEQTELGVIHYQADFQIARLIKGEPQDERRVGGTIPVNITRLELEPEDKLPQLKKGGRAILFLKCHDRQPSPSYVTADVWFGVQPPLPVMVDTLCQAADTKSERPHRVDDKPAADTPVPVAPPKPIQVELAGEWRVFLPAGFEHEMTLSKISDHNYNLQPAGYNIGGQYTIEGDRLVSVETNAPRGGRYVWKINTPYLLTLVEQTTSVGSDYTGAVLFRPTPHLPRDSMSRAAATGDK